MSNRPTYQPQEALARVLRSLREERGISQKDLARRVGISPSWLSKIESGHYDPPWSSVRRVTKGLSVSLGALEDAIDSFEPLEASAGDQPVRRDRG